MDEMILVIMFILPLWGTSISDELIIRASPSQKAVAGGKLDLSCSVSNQRFPILWRKNTNDIAENCIIYNDNGFKCKKTENTYHLIKNSLSWEDRGVWTCSHGPKTEKSIEVDVVVPALVYPLTVVPVESTRTGLIAGSASGPIDSGVGRGSLQLSGTGSRRDPIDLTVATAPPEILLECLTTCASIKPSIQWRSRNSSWTMTLHALQESDWDTPDARALVDTCPPGLSAIRQRVRITCASKARTQSNNGLVGLNRITCQPNHGSDQPLVQQAWLGGPHVDYSHPLSAMQSGWSASDYYGVDECGLKGKQIDACVYILCPGQPTTWFTLGERVALAVSIGLFILLSLLLCYLTRQRRRAKRKSNLAPGQRHEIELML